MGHAHATIYRMVMDEHVCPFGIKARDLLRRAGYVVNDEPLRSREATDEFKEEHGVETTPQVFIDGERIGGYEELERHLGRPVAAEGTTTYRPIVAVFVVTALMALAATASTEGGPVRPRSIELFVAYSMCVLAILKLRDLSSFSNRFVTYDIIARRRPLYANVYPFVEAFAGIGMLAGFSAWIVAPPAMFIGTVGAISVVKAVYLERRDLRCACVGGEDEVPLGFISLTENLMMVAMGIWMFVR